ncbi:MAG: DUF4974 domain-containing protein [Candidatus Pseudobacter hemicellulosilyticus]|uniref:DUF4974 domain-containing protein n=1 Tax=Candidatus Pseudobacter hemicellulosilyticus TaxID=3121375 RepID=A0AAJ5WX26_9BACT|nr:MAG: DUF4974 domain-containing protein [Pseudobacter sp.]
MMPEERIYLLATRFFEGSITEQEQHELAGWIEQSDNDAALADLLARAWETYRPTAELMALADTRLKGMPQKWYIVPATQQPAAGPDTAGAASVPVIALPVTRNISRKTNKWWWAAAAVLFLLLAGAATWLFLPPGKSSESPTAKNNIVPPGGNKAILTLADGSNIVLDSIGNGQLAAQGNVQILKQGDMVSYVFKQDEDNLQSHLYFNTIATPPGGEYRIVLPDGSKVWLNAASSIRFPARFAAHERRVAVTGECYFEVAAVNNRSGQKLPFIVSVHAGDYAAVEGNMADITVLGTQFNVNAYANEPLVKATLVEGRIRMALPDNTDAVELQPGAQARLQPGAGKITIDRNADLEEVLAWRNGVFSFSNADIPTVMRQLQRWYDVSVVYNGDLPDARFEGTIPRNSNLEEVLDIIRQTNPNIHVKLEGRKIRVTP